MPAKDPCKPFACKIQTCLRENNFQEAKCWDAINDMRECCKKWKDKSFVCQGMDSTKPENEKSN